VNSRYENLMIWKEKSMETKHQIYSQEQPIIAVRTEKLTSEDESNELLGDIKFEDNEQHNRT